MPVGQDVPVAGFPIAAFEVFWIPDFERRMERLKAVVTPRLRLLGEALAPRVAALVGEPMHPHVALHLRRRVNPPDDTWVAFGPSPRGYKALPHFEVGVDAKSVFVRFAIKPEGHAEKAPFFRRVPLGRLRELAAGQPVEWYAGDHGQDPVPVAALTPRRWSELRARALRKDGSVSVGLVIRRDDPVVQSPGVQDAVLERLAILAPLHRAARGLS